MTTTSGQSAWEIRIRIFGNTSFGGVTEVPKSTVNTRIE